MKIRNLLSFFVVLSLLFGCQPDFERCIESLDVEGDRIKVVLKIVHNDLINQYTKQDRLVIERTHFGIYPHDEIRIIDLNGTHQIATVGGYVGLYSNQVEVRLLWDTGSSLQQYDGNGVYFFDERLEWK